MFFKLIQFLLFIILVYSCQNNNPINSDISKYIVIFGDIQYYTNHEKLDLYCYSLDWIQRKAQDGWNFNCILHTGDITMSNTKFQWNCFYQATYPIAQKIPYFSMIGDHDYKWDIKGHINNRDSTYFNDYVKFSLSQSKVIEWFEEGRMENIVVENSIFGKRIDLLILEFGPRIEVLAWANEYVKSHPDHKFILMTHEYLECGGGRRTEQLKSISRLRNTTCATPEYLWNNLVTCNNNIKVVLCGHVGGLYALTLDYNQFGNEVVQIQHNIQSIDFRYDNWIMLWKFQSNSDQVVVSIINTKTDQYYNNQECLFNFNI